MMDAKFDLVIVGVGGQGTLLASKILGRLAVAQGLGVKVSEVHGMSQRGGSVITHVRVGDAVHAPLVTMGTADFLLSFEALEAARAAGYLKPNGVAIVNSQRIMPMPVITGAAAYPEDTLGQSALPQHTLEAVDALALAVEAGSQKAVNLVLLGMLSRHLPFEVEAWKQAIATSVPRATLATNIKAFEAGRTQHEPLPA
ncbi:MAG: indolepyruvate oxidoreductase subunit beta [Candidatus Limiplasma sp.]|nr:indolepyruvate oxidoreductase subunit beta [Candidatus Limiplasma sp.]